MELKNFGREKTAVFTHRCPTFLNYSEAYKGDVLNEAFAVELYDLIEASGIAFWAYRHHHSNTAEFSIENTTLLPISWVMFSKMSTVYLKEINSFICKSN